MRGGGADGGGVYDPSHRWISSHICLSAAAEEHPEKHPAGEETTLFRSIHVITPDVLGGFSAADRLLSSLT